jgi:CheY-like chemotaxis protein
MDVLGQQLEHDALEAGDTATGSAAAAWRHSRPLVLAVEDNPHDWEIYGKILWYNGFDVVHAGDGEEGLVLARHLLPDVVLLDLMIPKIDGMDLCRMLKLESQTASIPIVVLSSRERRRWEPETQAVGCMAYLEKPIGPVHVLHVIEEITGRAPPAGQGRPPRQRTAQEALAPDDMV